MSLSIQKTAGDNSQTIGEFPRVERTLLKKITLSPIVKGVVAGLIGALAMGIIFGPIAAVFGFCVGFLSAFLSSLANSKLQPIEIEAPQRRRFTQEEFERNPDEFFNHLAMQRQRIDVLRERARQSSQMI